jgi:5-formyltetrahydrofolate cyclo-ligase
VTDPASQAVEAVKQAIRRENRQRISAMAPSERSVADAAIRKAILEWSLPLATGVVCGFLPLPSEPNLGPLFRDLLDQGVRVGVPEIVLSPQPTLRMLEIKSASDLDSTEPSQLGTRVPRSSIILPPAEISTVMVPGLAFDRRGGRLGRGRGFFDSFLRSVKGHACTIGVAYELQVVQEVPREAHDEAVDCLCTERGVVRAG